MSRYPRHWWFKNIDSEPVFCWEEKKAWCANCGTVSDDSKCHCTDPTIGHGQKADWRPFDQACFDEISRLRAELDEAREALKPFANIEPSSFYAKSGYEAEGYSVILSAEGRVDFTGVDLARARAFIDKAGK